MSEEEMHILRHSLGLNDGRKMYRNHFVTGEGSIDHPLCMALAKKGLMHRHSASPLTGGDDLFTVTQAGKDVAIESLPPISRSKQRYLNWLDTDCGLTFGEYLKRGAA